MLKKVSKVRQTSLKILDLQINSIKDLQNILGLKGGYTRSRIGADPDAWVMKRLQINDRELAKEQLKKLIKKYDTERLNLNNDSAAAQSIDFEILNFLKALYLSDKDIDATIKLFFGARGIKKSDEEIEEFKKKIEQFLNI